MRTYTFAPGVIGTVLGMVLAACANTALPDDPAQRAAMLDRLRAGTAELQCTSLACSGGWGTIRRALRQDDSDGAWGALGLRVLSSGYRSDLGYWYLGRAAEGLDAPAAATTYYRIAAGIAGQPGMASKCDGFINVCDGVRLPAMADDRLAVLGASTAGDRLDGPPRPLPGQSPFVPLAGVVRHGETGMAEVTCIVTVIGTTRDCAVVALSGSPAFGSAVLAYARALRYLPARRGGVTVEQSQHYRVLLSE